MSRPSFGELGGQDPYEILELPVGAPDAEVRSARKRLLRQYHPDLPTGDLRRTQMITAAADLLLDPVRRTGYYDLRAHESKPAPASTAGGEWFDGSMPKPSSGTRTDGNGFHPTAGADGRSARSPGSGGARTTGPRPASTDGSGAATRRRATRSRRPAPYGGRWASRPRHRDNAGEPSGDDAGEPFPGTGGEPFPGTRGGPTINPPARPVLRDTTPTRPTPPPTGAAPNGGTAPVTETTAGPKVGVNAGPTQPIRPTFITPPSREPAGPGTPNGAAPKPSTPKGSTPKRPAAETSTPVRGGRRRRTYRARSDWNALAIAAVVSILTWTPIPLVLGLLALRQLRQYGQRGARLAIAAIVVGAILLLVEAYLLASSF